jgi:sugar phosphate isomerase/epimerase
MKVGLYSITYLGVWYRGPALTHEELIDRARQYGYEGIEIDGKRPHGNPLDLAAPRCRELQKRASGEGVPIYAVACQQRLQQPDPRAPRVAARVRPGADSHDRRPGRSGPAHVLRVAWRHLGT